MKPGDHPEFFRFPPPAGTSRESSIVLDRFGQFWHEAERVDHPAMARAFSSWIARHPDDGRFILSNGFDWTYFTVQDVPFFVNGLKEAAEGPRLVLSDGSEEPLAADTLSQDELGALYCRVKGARFEARFTPQAQTLLMPWLVEGEHAEVGLSIAGRVFSVTRRASK